VDTLLSRITIDPAVCHGKPCVRGLRYPVETLLELLSSGMTTDEILADYEDLEREDLRAVLAFAARLAQTRRLQPLNLPEYTVAAENRLFAWLDLTTGRNWDSLSEVEAAVWTAYALELQIANGGFHQALLNIGERWQEILKALCRIGAVKIAHMYEEALTVFPEGKPASGSQLRYHQMSALDQTARDLLWRLDGEYYDLYKTCPSENMYAKMYAFLVAEGQLPES
jgi:uncharacterized protein (DUF433 family)